MSKPGTTEELALLLQRSAAGDERALEDLFPLVYGELRRRAAHELRRESAGHTLQPTALVHEAYLKLSAGRVDATDRRHFVAIAAKAMRQVLVDHARKRAADKRGGSLRRTTLGTGDWALECAPDELLDLDRALDTLEARQRQVVELRFFGGLEEREIAALLGVTDRTVRRDWVKARAWLYAELYPESAARATEGAG